MKRHHYSIKYDSPTHIPQESPRKKLHTCTPSIILTPKLKILCHNMITTHKPNDELIHILAIMDYLNKPMTFLQLPGFPKNNEYANCSKKYLLQYVIEGYIAKKYHILNVNNYCDKSSLFKNIIEHIINLQSVIDTDTMAYIIKSHDIPNEQHLNLEILIMIFTNYEIQISHNISINNNFLKSYFKFVSFVRNKCYVSLKGIDTFTICLEYLNEFVYLDNSHVIFKRFEKSKNFQIICVAALLKYMFKTYDQYYIDHRSVKFSAIWCSTDKRKWERFEKIQWAITKIVEKFIIEGSFDINEPLHKMLFFIRGWENIKRISKCHTLITYAIAYGNLPLFELLLANGCVITSDLGDHLLYCTQYRIIICNSIVLDFGNVFLKMYEYLMMKNVFITNTISNVYPNTMIKEFNNLHRIFLTRMIFDVTNIIPELVNIILMYDEIWERV